MPLYPILQDMFAHHQPGIVYDTQGEMQGHQTAMQQKGYFAEEAWWNMQRQLK